MASTPEQIRETLEGTQDVLKDLSEGSLSTVCRTPYITTFNQKTIELIDTPMEVKGIKDDYHKQGAMTPVSPRKITYFKESVDENTSTRRRTRGSTPKRSNNNHPIPSQSSVKRPLSACVESPPVKREKLENTVEDQFIQFCEKQTTSVQKLIHEYIGYKEETVIKELTSIHKSEVDKFVAQIQSLSQVITGLSSIKEDRNTSISDLMSKSSLSPKPGPYKPPILQIQKPAPSPKEQKSLDPAIVKKQLSTAHLFINLNGQLKKTTFGEIPGFPDIIPRLISDRKLLEFVTNKDHRKNGNAALVVIGLICSFDTSKKPGDFGVDGRQISKVIQDYKLS